MVSLEVSILHTSPGNQKEIKLWKAFILCFYVSQKGKKLGNTAFKRLKKKQHVILRKIIDDSVLHSQVL
jgi:hypothetical protein